MPTEASIDRIQERNTMEKKKNCWEILNCGRQPGGAKVAELGVCPASVEVQVDGMNHGCNGGRACWAISGTLCGEKVQGTYAEKCGNCLKCRFYQAVKAEEGSSFKDTTQILEKLLL